MILKLKKNGSLTSRYAFDNTIAIRIPDNKCTINLIQLTKNKLLVGTSANLSDHSPLTNLKDLNTCNLQGYDAVIEGGKGGEAGKEQIEIIKKQKMGRIGRTNISNSSIIHHTFLLLLIL